MEFFTYLLQLVIISGIFYGYYHLFLRNNRFHKYNRYYILASIILSIVLPLLNISVYFTSGQITHSKLLNKASVYANYTLPGFDVHTGGNTIYSTFFLLLYIVVSVALLLVLVTLILKIIGIYRHSPKEKIGHVEVIYTNTHNAPFSFFNWLFWENSRNVNTIVGQVMWRHEMYHIRQKHSFDVLTLDIIQRLFWINPFFYLFKKEQHAIHEFLADAHACLPQQHWDYAELLLMQAFSTNHSFVNPFFNKHLKRRIAMITKLKSPRYQYLRKVAVLPIALLVLTLVSFKVKERIEHIQVKPKLTNGVILSPVEPTTITSVVQKKKDNDVTEKSPISISAVADDTSKLEKPLYVVDGVIIGNDKNLLKDIMPDQIAEVSVLKGNSASALYGEKGKDGVIIITTKKNADKKDDSNSKEVTVIGKPSDGQGQNSPTLKLKGQVNGEVVVVGYSNNKDDISSNEPVFEKAEVPPIFPGGQQAWSKFLERNLNASVPLNNKAPVGTYKCIVQFIVMKDGSLKQIRPITNLGYGIEGEVIRLMQLSDKWIPAKQNGFSVNAYVSQPVTFVVEGK